jgi:hypothetical protein
MILEYNTYDTAPANTRISAVRKSWNVLNQKSCCYAK